MYSCVWGLLRVLAVLKKTCLIFRYSCINDKIALLLIFVHVFFSSAIWESQCPQTLIFFFFRPELANSVDKKKSYAQFFFLGFLLQSHQQSKKEMKREKQITVFFPFEVLECTGVNLTPCKRENYPGAPRSRVVVVFRYCGSIHTCNRASTRDFFFCSFHSFSVPHVHVPWLSRGS